MFEAVVPVEDTCLTETGKIVPETTLENVVLVPSLVTTVILPPVPMYKALAFVANTESAGVIANAIDAQESADLANIITSFCL
jgi:hypothetical protein